MKQLFIAMIALLYSTTASAHDFEVDGIYYNINGSEVAVTYKGNSLSSYINEYTESVVIPSTVSYNGKNYSVTSIGSSAFYDCSGLTSVVIPNSVTSIGDRAFIFCSGLISVVIPNSVTSIGDEAFSGCSGLTGVTISNSVTSIGSSAFYGCSGLISVVIPNSVTSIGERVFQYCSSLTSVVIPNCVTSIVDYMFYGCSDLTSVVIPNSVTSIGGCAFYGCSGLTSVVIPDSVTIIGSCAFDCCSGLTSITIPNSVTSIGSSAFSGCSGLTSVVIPNSVTSIEDNTFRGCSGLTSITIPNSVTSIGHSAFKDCSSLASIEIPNSVIGIGGDAFYGCSGLTSVVIPNSVTSIWDNTFYGCSGLTSVVIPNSVKSIRRCAFSGCSGLTSIVIPNSVKSIGYSAFSGCSGLTSVVIPNSVTSISGYMFEGCSGLTSVVIPNSVTSIGSNAFSGCSGLANVVIGNSVAIIGEYAFANCNNIETIFALSRISTTCNENTFSETTYNNAILYVPEEREFAYGETTPWSNFYIEPMKKYNAIYMVDGIEYAKYSVEIFSEIPVPETPFKEGYTFKGWSDAPATMPAEDVTINGTYAVNYYNVTYVVDGKIFATDSIAYGSGIKLIAAPEKEGYTFSGWGDAPATMPAEDVTINGTYAVNYYNVTYVVDGKIFATDSIAYGSGIKLIAAPEKEGYTFSGWGDAPATMPAEDVTISGAFAVNYYKVTYIVDKEIFATDSVAYGSGIKLIAAPEKEGYTFYGWSDAPTTMPAADVTINGSFEVNTYAVTYIVDGNTVAVDSVAYGAEITPIAVPVKEGYTFSGWGDAPATMPAEDVTINGTYAVNYYKVTYIVDKEIFATDSVAYGSGIKLIAAPEKEGYTFYGWSDAPTTMPAADVTINGSFEVNTYAVTYIVDGDTVAVDSVAYGAEITPIAVPVKEGYTFSGWSEAPATMPANDIVISGSFEINTYVVTYIVDGKTFATDSIVFNSDVNVISAPEKEGYTFSGWSYAPKKMPAEDIVISGTFSVNYYTITYLVDGEEYKSEQVAYGTEIKLLDAPEKEGHTFSGWSYAPKKMPAENITISGSFSVNYYTITYIVDGVAYDSLAVAYGSEITLIAAPEKEGYTFSGWSDAPATMPAEDIIITGSFVHTSINSVSAEATVKVNGNIITLVGAEGKAVAVYSTNGALVEKIDSYAGEEIALDKGVYIVRVGGKTVKVKL